MVPQIAIHLCYPKTTESENQEFRVSLSYTAKAALWISETNSSALRSLPHNVASYKLKFVHWTFTWKPIALLGRNYFVTIGIAPPFPGRHGRVGRVWWTAPRRHCDPPILPAYVKNGKIWRFLFFMHHVIKGYFRLEHRVTQREALRSSYLLKPEIPETTLRNKQNTNKPNNNHNKNSTNFLLKNFKILVSSSWFLSNWPFPTCLTSPWSQHCSKGQRLPFEATRNSVESSNSRKHPSPPPLCRPLVLQTPGATLTLAVALDSSCPMSGFWNPSFTKTDDGFLHTSCLVAPRLQECILLVVASQFYSFLLPSVVTLSHFSWPSRERLLASSHEE